MWIDNNIDNGWQRLCCDKAKCIVCCLPTMTDGEVIYDLCLQQTPKVRFLNQVFHIITPLNNSHYDFLVKKKELFNSKQ